MMTTCRPVPRTSGLPPGFQARIKRKGIRPRGASAAPRPRESPRRSKVRIVIFVVQGSEGSRSGPVFPAQALLADLLLDFRRDFGVVLQKLPGVLAALPQPLAVVGEPGPALLDDVQLGAKVENASLPGNAL